MLVELLFGLTVKLVVFLQESFLWPNLNQGRSSISNAPTLEATPMLWCSSFNLVDGGLAWVDLIDYGEAARKFRTMPW